MFHSEPAGLFLASQPRIISCGVLTATWTLACRFLLAPLLTALFSLALGLRGTYLHIATVQAALPPAIVAFVFAAEYKVHPEVLSTG